MQQTETESGLPFAEFRALLAAGLTLAVPGLGHLFCQRFRRGLAWFGLFAFTAVFLSAYPAGEPTLFLTSVLSAELGAMDVAFPGSIMVLCLVDLYLLERFE